MTLRADGLAYPGVCRADRTMRRIVLHLRSFVRSCFFDGLFDGLLNLFGDFFGELAP